MSSLNKTLDDNGKTSEMLGGRLLKILDENNMLNNMEKVLLMPNARYKRWRVKRKQIIAIKAMAGMGLNDFETVSTCFQRSKKFDSVIPFRVDSIDKLLDGGIDVGSLTELFGEAGSGKTQLCLQLALNCVLPVEQEGLGGQVVYVTTEKDFPVQRFAEMACSRGYPQAMDNILITKFSMKQSLEHFLVNQLPSMLENRPLVKLVVIDSIAGVFRIETDYLQRAKDMRWAANELYRLADQHHFAILITNQVTIGRGKFGLSKNVACLGPSWETQVSTKLEVKKTQSIVHKENTTVYRKRTLEVVYSPRLPPGKADFVAVESGIQSL